MNEIHSKEEWELKFIISKLAIKFLILHDKDVNKLILLLTCNSMIGNVLTHYMKLLEII